MGGKMVLGREEYHVDYTDSLCVSNNQQTHCAVAGVYTTRGDSKGALTRGIKD